MIQTVETEQQTGRRPRSSWPDERTEALKKSFFAGKSYGLMAREFGVSRNVLSGKVLREGWTRDETTARLTPVASGKPAAARRRAQATLPLEGVRAVRIEELGAGECKWPLFQDADRIWLFCGCATRGLYCAPHHKRATRPPTAVELAAVSKGL